MQASVSPFQEARIFSHFSPLKTVTIWSAKSLSSLLSRTCRTRSGRLVRGLALFSTKTPLLSSQTSYVRQWGFRRKRLVNKVEKGMQERWTMSPSFSLPSSYSYSWPDFKTSRGIRHLAHLWVYIRKSSTWIIEKEAWLQRLRIRELGVRLFFSTFKVFAEDLEKRHQKGKLTVTEWRIFSLRTSGHNIVLHQSSCQGKRASFWLFMQEFYTWLFLPRN